MESLPFIQNAQDRREIWVDDIYLGVVTILRIFTILTLDEKSNQMYISRQIRPKSEPLDPTLSKKIRVNGRNQKQRRSRNKLCGKMKRM